MSWTEYVKHHLAGRTQVGLAALVGVSAPGVSRWLKGTQGVDAHAAVAFARAVGDSPLVALVAAGVIDPDDVGATVVIPDYGQLSNDELLELVRARMRREEGEGNAERAPSTRPALKKGAVLSGNQVVAHRQRQTQGSDSPAPPPSSQG